MLDQLHGNVRRAATVLIIGFVGVALALGYWQVVRGPELATASANPRVAEARMYSPRGRILDRSGQVLAHSVETPQGMRRQYAEPSLVHTVGFHSPRFGSTNVEAKFDLALRGERSPDAIERLRSELLGIKSEITTADVVLTVDRRIHEAAVAALGDANGAIVALDPKTGAVLALAVRPFFNPNQSDEQLAALPADPAQPLFNRAVQSLYVPGSTFKAVTAAAAIERGLVNLDEPFTCTGPVKVGEYPIDCRNSQHVPRLTYKQAFAWSSNRAFALSGLQLGYPGPMNPWLSDSPPGPYPWVRGGVQESAVRLEDAARRFGFTRDVPFELDITPSPLKREGSEWTPQLLAQTAFGQGELQATPLQMALVAAAIANAGNVPSPYLVSEVRSASSQAVSRPHQPDLRGAFSRAMSAETARTMLDFMVEGVERGYGEKAAIPGVKVGGKTGTAELGDGASHSWFIGLAPAEDPRIAIAVIGERRGSGADFATIAARPVLQVALEVYKR